MFRQWSRTVADRKGVYTLPADAKADMRLAYDSLGDRAFQSLERLSENIISRNTFAGLLPFLETPSTWTRARFSDLLTCYLTIHSFLSSKDVDALATTSRHLNLHMRIPTAARVIHVPLPTMFFPSGIDYTLRPWISARMFDLCAGVIQDSESEHPERALIARKPDVESVKRSWHSNGLIMTKLNLMLALPPPTMHRAMLLTANWLRGGEFQKWLQVMAPLMSSLHYLTITIDQGPKTADVRRDVSVFVPAWRILEHLAPVYRVRVEYSKNVTSPVVCDLLAPPPGTMVDSLTADNLKELMLLDSLPNIDVSSLAPDLHVLAKALSPWLTWTQKSPRMTPQRRAMHRSVKSLALSMPDRAFKDAAAMEQVSFAPFANLLSLDLAIELTPSLPAFETKHEMRRDKLLLMSSVIVKMLEPLKKLERVLISFVSSEGRYSVLPPGQQYGQSKAEIRAAYAMLWRSSEMVPSLKTLYIDGWGIASQPLPETALCVPVVWETKRSAEQLAKLVSIGGYDSKNVWRTVSPQKVAPTKMQLAAPSASDEDLINQVQMLRFDQDDPREDSAAALAKATESLAQERESRTRERERVKARLAKSRARIEQLEKQASELAVQRAAEREQIAELRTKHALELAQAAQARKARELELLYRVHEATESRAATEARTMQEHKALQIEVQTLRARVTEAEADLKNKTRPSLASLLAERVKIGIGPPEFNLDEMKSIFRSCSVLAAQAQASMQIVTDTLRHELQLSIAREEETQRALARAKHELKTREPTMCVACQSAPVKYIWGKCGHNCFCKECGEHESIKSCPLCRCEVPLKVVVY